MRRSSSFGDVGIGAASEDTERPSRKRLKVGQVITFECSATDPFDRPIVWNFVLYNTDTKQGVSLDNAYGATTVFDWAIKPEHYGERRALIVSMSNNSQCKRDGSSDGVVVFAYDVNPPVPPSPHT